MLDVPRGDHRVQPLTYVSLVQVKPRRQVGAGDGAVRGDRGEEPQLVAEVGEADGERTAQIVDHALCERLR